MADVLRHRPPPHRKLRTARLQTLRDAASTPGNVATTPVACYDGRRAHNIPTATQEIGLSYYTRVRFDFSDEPPEIEEVSAIVRSWLSDQNYDVDEKLDDFVRGWIPEGETDFCGLCSDDIEDLMTNVSSHYPHIRFYVRGMGEEFGDVWLRVFEGGKMTFTLGPFPKAPG